MSGHQPLKEIVIQITKAKNENNRIKLLDLLEPEFKAHIAGNPNPLTREEYIHAIEMSHSAFSHLHFKIEDMIQEEDKIALRIIQEGKHTGTYQGHEASHSKVSFSGIIILRIVNGKVVEEWQVNDTLGLLRQIGLSVNHIV